MHNAAKYTICVFVQKHFYRCILYLEKYNQLLNDNQILLKLFSRRTGGVAMMSPLHPNLKGYICSHILVMSVNWHVSWRDMVNSCIPRNFKSEGHCWYGFQKLKH